MNILIAEDEALIAFDTAYTVEALGHKVTGPFGRADDAKAGSDGIEIALVDVNLSDGETGPALADFLYRGGATVIFTTGNPEIVESNTSAIGILVKPYTTVGLTQAIDYASAYRMGTPLPHPGILHVLG
ncbi:response regulator [Rhizobium sp. P40RR-XXII]|uniref:response regulator n=1 Tax=Rhizobium sp. P40RR-XXII TaxID=2726739 RepID=UPI0014567583|nr:response regulator [Rhizobium sp. P40RR-XXII]NLS20004.1 response regulator [Rhizobium sp. P40RR-XXII]